MALAVCRVIVSFTWVYRDGIWFGFVRPTLRVAIVFSWVDRCVGSGFKRLCTTTDDKRYRSRRPVRPVECSNTKQPRSGVTDAASMPVYTCGTALGAPTRFCACLVLQLLVSP